MIQKIKRYPLPILNSINEIEIPQDSFILSVVALPSDTNVVNVLVLSPVPKDDEDQPTRKAKLLVINNESPFDDEPEEDKMLQYIGTAIWDSGYRMSHVFELENLFDPAQIIAVPDINTDP